MRKTNKRCANVDYLNDTLGYRDMGKSIKALREQFCTQIAAVQDEVHIQAR